MKASRAAAGAAASAAAVAAALIAYGAVTSSLGALAELSPASALCAAAALVASNAIAAARLRLIHAKYSGRALRFRDYFGARMLGQLAAILTPSAYGGEVGRAAYLASHGSGFGEMLALSYYEVFYDVVATNAVGMALSLRRLPAAWPVLAVGALTLAAWLGFAHAVLVSGWAQRALSRARLAKRALALVAERAEDVRRAFAEVSGRLGPADVLAVVALTLAYNFAQAAAVLPLAGPARAAEAVEAYFYSQTLAAMPTPAGAGFAELGLGMALPPGLVVQFRAVYLLAYAAAGVITLAAASRRLVGANWTWTSRG